MALNRPLAVACDTKPPRPDHFPDEFSHSGYSVSDSELTGRRSVHNAYSQDEETRAAARKRAVVTNRRRPMKELENVPHNLSKRGVRAVAVGSDGRMWSLGNMAFSKREKEETGPPTLPRASGVNLLSTTSVDSDGSGRAVPISMSKSIPNLAHVDLSVSSGSRSADLPVSSRVQRALPVAPTILVNTETPYGGTPLATSLKTVSPQDRPAHSHQQASDVPSEASAVGSGTRPTVYPSQHELTKLATTANSIRPRSGSSSLQESNALSTGSLPSELDPAWPLPENRNASSDLPSSSGSIASLGISLIANRKKNAEFHSLFPSVPRTECLIDDFGCAVQREILAHGKLFISDRRLCFKANIFGWVTALDIPFATVTAIEKKFTALVIPNAILVTTTDRQYFFTSFMSREQAHSLMIKLWKAVNPSAHAVFATKSDTDCSKRASKEQDEHARGVTGDGMGSLSSRGSSSSSSVASGVGNESDTEDSCGSDRGNDGYCNAQAHSRHVIRTTESPPGLGLNNLATLLGTESTRNQKPSHAFDTGLIGLSTTPCEDKAGTRMDPSSVPNPGPDHLGSLVTDCTIELPVKRVFDLIYGSHSYNGDSMMRKYGENNGHRDLAVTDWRKEDGVLLRREVKYTMPLKLPLGPKQTKVETVEDILESHEGRAYEVRTQTITPDVPSGTNFTTNSRVSLLFHSCHSTRIYCTLCVQWSKSSWMKGPIEKGALEGHKEYLNSIVEYLNKTRRASPVRDPAAVEGSHSSHPVRRRRRKGEMQVPVSRSPVAHRAGGENLDSPCGATGVSRRRFDGVRNALERLRNLNSPFNGSSGLLLLLCLMWLYNSYLTWVLLVPSLASDSPVSPPYSPRTPSGSHFPHSSGRISSGVPSEEEQWLLRIADLATEFGQAIREMPRGLLALEGLSQRTRRQGKQCNERKPTTPSPEPNSYHDTTRSMASSGGDESQTI